MSRVCCQLSPCSAEALREKVSFHSSPQLPDVLLKTFCFLIGPQGAAPTLPPFCSPGNQSQWISPVLWACLFTGVCPERHWGQTSDPRRAKRLAENEVEAGLMSRETSPKTTRQVAAETPGGLRALRWSTAWRKRLRLRSIFVQAERRLWIYEAEQTSSFFLKGFERVRTEHAQWKTNQKLLNYTGKLAPSPPSTCITNKSCSNVH